MKSVRPSPQPERIALNERYRQQRHDARFTLLLGFLSFVTLLAYYSRQELLLYGDAVAHINIARRVIDNRHPASFFIQFGTVWLPLQHAAMLPFVWNKALWQSGIAGAIPGMVGYVLGGLGIFRLVSSRTSPAAAYFAAAIYALNPNLLYMQTTAMNEPIMLAFLIWTLVYMDELLRAAFPSETRLGMPARMSPERAMEACGIAMAGAALTRYDGWFLAAVLASIIGVLVVIWWRRNPGSINRRVLAKSFVELLLLNALIPVFWLIYTRNVSGYALDFLNGPYSAKAIALRMRAENTPSYPGQHSLFTAVLYFLKAAKLDVGPDLWGQLMLALAIAGTTIAVWQWRRYGAFLLLWLPLPFYALSIAYGSVPIFLPDWYPFSYYNVRYGLELLPVFAVFSAIFANFLVECLNDVRRWVPAWVVLAAIVASSYVSIYRETPVTLREARVNSRTRISMETALANFLVRMPRDATLLMYLGEHVGALQRADIPLRRVISEGAHPDWEWALVDPGHHADFLIACQGDPMSMAVREHRTDLEELLAINVPGQARCAIYRPR